LQSTISVRKVNATAFKSVRGEQYLVGPPVIGVVGKGPRTGQSPVDVFRFTTRKVTGHHRIPVICGPKCESPESGDDRSP